jgi:putative transposase
MVGIKLKEDELNLLMNFVKKGRKSARELTRARILLLANQQKGDTEIAEILDVGRTPFGEPRKDTVKRTFKVP